MVNKNDFYTELWTKQPMHQLLLPQSNKKIMRCSNPELFKVKNLNLLGSTG